MTVRFRFWQILLQKSAVTAECRSAISLRATGFDPPALTPSTQLLRYAIHRARAGGGRATSDASRRRFWAMAARTNSSWAPRGPRSRSRPSFRMGFKCEPHLDLLALTSRLLKVFGAGERPGNVSGMLMDVARDFARWFLWAALRFEWANIAVELAGTI